MLNLFLVAGGVTADIIIFVVLALAAICGWVSGFLRSMLSFFSLIIAIALAYFLCDVALNFLEEKFSVVTSLAAWYQEKLFSAEFLTATVSAEGLETAFEKLHFPAFLADLIRDSIVPLAEEGTTMTIGYVFSVFAARMTLQAILFFVLIAVFIVLLFLLGRLFSALIEKIPIIGTLNRVLGAVFGLILALFGIYFVLFLAYLFFGEKAGAFFEQSTFGNFLYQHNLFGVILQNYVWEGVKKFFEGLLPSPTASLSRLVFAPLPQ